MNIRYVKNIDIDKTRWDQVIDNSPQGRIYAYSWYLDALAENWDALLLGDYEVIMPLPWKSKYGVFYIYTPYFVQQLGLFSEKEMPSGLYAQFLRAIPFKFRYIDLSLNTDEDILLKGIKTRRRTNYTLDIDRPYSEILNGFHKNARRILREPATFNLVESDDFAGIIESFKNLKGQAFENVKEEHYQRLLSAVLAAQTRKCVQAYQLFDVEDRLLTSFLFFISHSRAYYIIGAQTEDGFSRNANYLLFNAFIENHSKEIKTLDFEGSDIAGIAAFFKKWGSQPEYYTGVRLPRFPFDFLKK